MNKQLNLCICIYICLKPSFKLGQASSWIWGNGHTIDSSPQVFKRISLFISKQVNKLSLNIFSFYILHKSRLIVNLRSATRATIRNQLHCVRQTARQSPVCQFHRLLAAQSPVGIRSSRHPGNFLTEHWSSEGRLPLAREDGLTALCRPIPGCHQQQLTHEKLSNRAHLAWVPSTSFCCRAGVRCVAALSGNPGAERR